MKRTLNLLLAALFILSTFNVLFAGRYYMPEVARWATPDPALQQMYPPQLLKIHNGMLLSTSPYAYTFNNPLRYTDPNGKTPWDVLDIAAAGLSLKDFIQNPTWGNAGWLAADVVGLLPLVPSTGLFRHGAQLLSKADLIKFNAKAGKAAEQLVETGLKESGESFAKQVVRESSRLDFVTGAGKVIEVKNINWGAKTYQRSGGISGRITQISKQLEKYKGTLKEGEQLILKISKPEDTKVIEQLQNMTREVGAKIEWLD